MAWRLKNTGILGAWRGVKNLHMLLLRSLVGIQTIKAISSCNEWALCIQQDNLQLKINHTLIFILISAHLPPPPPTHRKHPLYYLNSLFYFAGGFKMQQNSNKAFGRYGWPSFQCKFLVLMVHLWHNFHTSAQIFCNPCISESLQIIMVLNV